MKPARVSATRPETQPNPAWISFFQEALRLSALARSRREEASDTETQQMGRAQTECASTGNDERQ